MPAEAPPLQKGTSAPGGVSRMSPLCDYTYQTDWTAYRSSSGNAAAALLSFLRSGGSRPPCSMSMHSVRMLPSPTSWDLERFSQYSNGPPRYINVRKEVLE